MNSNFLHKPLLPYQSSPYRTTHRFINQTLLQVHFKTAVPDDTGQDPATAGGG